MGPDLASGATVERQVLHRAVGDKEVRDTLTVRHSQDEDGWTDSGRDAADTHESGKAVTPQRQVKNIETEEELATFERQFSDSAMGQDLRHQPHHGHDEQLQQPPLFNRCQRRRYQRMVTCRTSGTGVTAMAL